ncbi:MAG TPA: two-component regulator propeller domain-containing protein [Gammaproteobacteria bacterium]|jgi:diguanylate cyclase (GGDEF)-like protein
MRRFGLIIATLMLLAGPAGSLAAAGPFPPGSTPHFRHIGAEDGLVNSDVHALLQDATGYMWIGTDNGLQRYDGYRFVTWVHDPQDAGSLSQNIVTALAFTPDGTLWAGTESEGLESLAPGAGHFTHHRHDPEKAGSLADDRVFALLFDKQGRLWVGTDKGVDRMEVDGSFHHYATHSTLPNGERILSLYQAPDGRLWIGSDHGVFWYDAKSDALLRFAPQGGAAVAAMAVLDTAPIGLFYTDHGGRLWIGSEHGIGVVERDGRLERFYTQQPGKDCALQSDHVRGLLEDEEGGMWLALLHGGIAHLDNAGCFSVYLHDATDPASLRDDDPRVMYRDRTGLIWIGAYYSGIDIYNPRTRAFGYYRARPGSDAGLAGSMVTSVYKQPDGTLWVGTLQGLTRMDVTRRHYQRYILPGRPPQAMDDLAVNAVYGDREGRLWVGTDYGLSQYLPGKDSFEFHRLVDAGGDPYQTSVSYIFEDAQRRLWLGTEAGLLRFDAASGEVAQRLVPDARRDDALPNGQVNAVCQSRDGTLWAATLKGLARFDGTHDSFQTYGEGGDTRHSLSSGSILSCLGDAAGRVWVGTDNGVDVLDPKGDQVRRFGHAEGMPDLNVAAILQDRAGDLWLGTAKGIVHFSSEGVMLRNYVARDGLQRGEFNDGAAYAAADGELFFGGSNGLNSFYPKALEHTAAAPTAAITGFTVLGKPYDLDAATPQLRYRDNILGFEFAAFDYAEPAHNRFRYMLEGFDEDWRSTNGERDVTYTNLDPGRYVLHLKGSDDGQHWSEQEATLAIQVLPPPWRSWWAYVGYVLGFLLLGVGSFALFARSLRRRQAYAEERNRRRWAEALHQLIQSVTALEDEGAIAGVLLDTLMSFIEHDRALFYVERPGGLTLISSRGGDASEHVYHERWPITHMGVADALRKSETPRMLTPAEAATLEPQGHAPRHYLCVPLASATSPFRLLLVGRESKTIQTQGLDIAAAMAKQVSVALDRALLIKDLEKLATTDGLTRLHIRRSFLERAQGEFERSRRYQRPLSVLMLDVDHFKRVNDSYGHETGDRVLRVLADACRAGLRQQDLIGRYGGEEFVAALPETTAAVAQDTAERLRRAVEELTVNSPQGPVKLTISIGVATLNAGTTSISGLINAADRALYEAKQKGRNRVVVSN